MLLSIVSSLSRLVSSCLVLAQVVFFDRRASQILANRKSVSVWQARNAKIDESRTFDLRNYARKYVKLDKMVESTMLNNLGTPRTEKRMININFLIQPIPRQLNSGCIGRIKNLIFIGHCGVLDSLRLSSVVFSTILSSFTYFLV